MTSKRRGKWRPESRGRNPEDAQATGRTGILKWITVTLVALTITASAAACPKRWHATNHPRWFREAICIHHYEGAWNDATGNGYEGGMQFLLSTWTSVGGRVSRSGHWASVASPREQLYRAWLVWLRDGRTWREWGSASVCGLR